MRGAIPYSESELAFVCANARTPRATLHAAFVATFDRHDVTVDHLKALCARNGWATRARWTADDDDYLRTHFPHTQTFRIAAALGRTATATSARAMILGVSKDAAYLATPASGRTQPGSQRGGATRFKAGQPAFNKGVKRPEGWAPGRMKDTQFAKGQAGWNHRPVGHTRMIAGYEYTKISDHRRVSWNTNWKATHTLAWEALHGPIPEGFALKCVDSNRRNTDASNWTLIPRAILPRLNGGRQGRLGYDDAPAELRPTLLAVAKLTHAVRQRRSA